MVSVDQFVSTSGLLGTFIGDVHASVRTDPRCRTEIFDLWFNYLEGRLGSMGQAKLDAYLAGLQVWRTQGVWKIYKTASVPCVAFTAYMTDAGDLYLLALGACCDYPSNNADLWWTNVIAPRIGEL